MRPYLIGIAGGSASGKSTIAQRLLSHAGPDTIAVIALDQYYKSLEHLSIGERAVANYDHPATIEWDLIVNQLQLLLAGHPVDTPMYDFVRHTRDPHNVKRIIPKPFIIVEGILTFASPPLRDLLNLRVFVDAPEDLRFTRRLARDTRERGRTPESVKEQWDSTVQTMHREFCEPTRNYADLVLDGRFAKELSIEELWQDVLARSRRVE
jgi:uridine kinase